MSSRFPLFHYLFVTSLPCPRLRFFHLIFVTSQYYLLKISSVSLSVCYDIALFSASAASSSVCYEFTTLYYLLKVSIVSLSVSYVIALFSALAVLFCLLCHNAISSGFPLFYYLFVTSLLCSRLQLSPLTFVMSL